MANTNWKKSEVIQYLIIYNLIAFGLLFSTTGHQSEEYKQCIDSNRTCSVVEKPIMTRDYRYVITKEYIVMNIYDSSEKSKYWGNNGEEMLGRQPFTCYYKDNKLRWTCDEYMDNDQKFDESIQVLAYIMISLEAFTAFITFMTSICPDGV